MGIFDKLLSTLEVVYSVHGFSDVNDDIIRDTLLLAEKNKLRLIHAEFDLKHDIQFAMTAIILARLDVEKLSYEREVVLFERLFNSICEVIDG